MMKYIVSFQHTQDYRLEMMAVSEAQALDAAFSAHRGLPGRITDIIIEEVSE
jgi:hypothetical protein